MQESAIQGRPSQVVRLGATFLDFAFLHRFDLVNELCRALRRHLSHLTGSVMTVKNGLYSIRIEMKDGGRGHASGIIVLIDGQILGGDTHFYYTGSYTFKNGRWRGELTTRQHAQAVGVILLFGGREVTCGIHRDIFRWRSGGRRNSLGREDQRPISR